MNDRPTKRVKRDQDESSSAGQKQASSSSRELHGDRISLLNKGSEDEQQNRSSALSIAASTNSALSLRGHSQVEDHSHRDGLVSPSLQALFTASIIGEPLGNFSTSAVNARPDLLLQGESSNALDLLLRLRANQTTPSLASAGFGSGAAAQLAELRALRLRAAGLGGGFLSRPPPPMGFQDSFPQQSFRYLEELEALRLSSGNFLERVIQQQRQGTPAASCDSTQRQLSSFPSGTGQYEGPNGPAAATGMLVDSFRRPTPHTAQAQRSLPTGRGETKEEGRISPASQGMNILDPMVAQNVKRPATQLPPVEKGDTRHYSQRMCVPLAIEEDPNWLSERQCYIRAELLEVVRASHEEVLVRSSSKSIAYQQVGIRCRFCAHMQPASRAIRSSAYPSSIRQMYQSFTMMVRDHFANCSAIPQAKKQHFLELKGLTSPSSSLSRQYWTYAAQKLGMVDSEYGIMISKDTQAEARKMSPFGTTKEESESIKDAPVKMLIDSREQQSISPYLNLLMSQVQIVHLLPSEKVGKRKDAAANLSGFGCIYCAKAGRLGFCRMFPLNKRSLPDKINDMFAHLQRCPSCPSFTKTLLDGRRHDQLRDQTYTERDREFIDRIWVKLGRDSDEAFQK